MYYDLNAADLVKGSNIYYNMLNVGNLTQNNIDEIEKYSASGGGSWGTRIQRVGTSIKQFFVRGNRSLGGSETGNIDNKIELFDLSGEGELIFETENSNVNLYNLGQNKTIICPLDILIGFDHGCKIGICRNRNWNHNLSVLTEGNGLKELKRDFDYFNKTEFEYNQDLTQYENDDLEYYKEEIESKIENIKNNIENIQEEGYISDLGLNMSYQLENAKIYSGVPIEGTNIQKEINEINEKIDEINQKTNKYMTFYNSIKDEVDGQEVSDSQKDIINQDLEKKKYIKMK